MQKGFNTDKIREYFEVLRHSKMFLHGYFILGCIGESKEDMQQIAPFAHELGVDTIALSTLRTGLHSALDDLVAESPGYHIAENGKVYSDELSVKDLRRLRRSIYKEFYGPKQVMRIIRKGIQNDAMSFVTTVLPRAPKIIGVSIAHEFKKNRRRAKKRRDRKKAGK